MWSFPIKANVTRAALELRVGRSGASGHGQGPAGSSVVLLMPAVYVHGMDRETSGRDLGFCQRVGSGLGNGGGAPWAAEAP